MLFTYGNKGIKMSITWSDKFIRTEEALRLLINNVFKTKISDDEFKRIKCAYLHGRLDRQIESENQDGPMKEELCKLIQTAKQMTKDEFEKSYAEHSGVTVASLHEQGQFAEECTCSEECCKGWVWLQKVISEESWRTIINISLMYFIRKNHYGKSYNHSQTTNSNERY
jgi:hypothetical protein